MNIDDNTPLSKKLGLDFSKIKSSETIVKLGSREGYDIPVGTDVQGKPTTFGESQYDIPFTTSEAIQSDEYKYYRGERQSAADKWANGILRFVGKTPARIIEGVLNPFVGVTAAIVDQDASKLWDNAITNGVNDLGKALDEELPLYETRDSESATGFGKLAYANTWAGDILDGVSYSVAAMASGNIHTKLLTTLSKAATLGRTVEFLNNLSKIENAADKIKYITQIDDVFKTQIKDGIKKGTFALMGATTEASDNALSDSNEWVQKMTEQLTQGGQRELTDGEKQWLDENRKKLGNTSYAINLPVIMADNWLTFGKSIMGKGGEKLLMSEASDLIERTAEGGYKATKKGFIQNALDKTYGIRKVAGRTIPEALQEQLQYGITKGTDDFYTKKYYNPNAASFIESMQIGLTEAFATQQGWDQALIGGIVGGLTGNVMSIKAEGLKAYKSPTDQLVADALDVLNNTKSKDAYKAAIETINRHANLTEEQAAAAKANNDFEYQNKQSDLFLNYVLGRIKTGKTDDLVSDLNDFKSLSAEEFENTYDVKLGVDELTGAKQTVADFVQKRLDKVNKIQKLYNSLENIVPNAPNNLKDRLLYSAFALEDARDRATTLDTEVKGIIRDNMHNIFNPTEKAALMTDYTQLTEPTAKALYRETLLNSTVSPVDQQTILKKLDDYDKLQERQAQFVREYKELLDPAKQAEIMDQDTQAENIVNRSDEDLQTGQADLTEEGVPTTEEQLATDEELINAYSEESTDDLNARLQALADMEVEDPRELDKHVNAINEVLKSRAEKASKVKRTEVNKPNTTTGNVDGDFTEDEINEILNEEDDEIEIDEADANLFGKILELQNKVKSGEITEAEFTQKVAELSSIKEPAGPSTSEQDLVSNSMVNEYIDTNTLTDDNDVNQQDVVFNTNADGRSLAKMSNIGMMRLFNHTYNVIVNTPIRLFRWVRGVDGKVTKTDSAISTNVNNANVASKGSRIIYKLVELDAEAKKRNDENILKSKDKIKAALKVASGAYGYTEADAKFEGDVYTATIGMFTEDGTLVGYYQLPHALDVTKTTSRTDLENYVKVRQQILAERKLILDTIAYGYEASTEVLDKGYGNLLTQVVDNKPVMQGNLFDGIRETDKFNGQPIFAYEGTNGFEVKGSADIKAAYGTAVASILKFNKPGKLYQVVKAANGKLTFIPVYTNLISDNVANKIVEALQELDEAPKFRDIISKLNKYIYAGNSKDKPSVSLDVRGDGAKTKFNIGGQTYTLAEIQANSSRVADFKKALTKKRHNIEVDNINNKAYQKELASNNALSTNAYTEDGHYYVQPLIIVKPVVGEVTKVTPVKNKAEDLSKISQLIKGAGKSIMEADLLKSGKHVISNIRAASSIQLEKIYNDVKELQNKYPNKIITTNTVVDKNYMVIEIKDKPTTTPTTDATTDLKAKKADIKRRKNFSISDIKEDKLNKNWYSVILNTKGEVLTVIQSSINKEQLIEDINYTYDAELDALGGKPSEEIVISASVDESEAQVTTTTKVEVETDPKLTEASKKLDNKLKGKNEFEITDDSDELYDDAFSRPKDRASKPLNTKDVKKVEAFIRKYVPFLTLSDVREVSKIKGAMIDSVGMLRGTTMYLFNGAKVKTAYHEAFHGVFRNMLTKDEQQAVLDEVKAKYGKATSEQIEFQKQAIPLYYKSILSEEQINQFAENKHYEEVLADEFMDVADTEVNKPWYKKIADFFKRIFKLFNIFSKTTLSQSEQLFNNILAGKYAKGKPVVLNNDINKYNEIPAYSRPSKIITRRGKSLNSLTQMQRATSIANELAKAYTAELRKGKVLTKEEQNKIAVDISNNLRNKYKQAFLDEMSKENPNLNIAEVSEAILDNWDVFMNDAKAIMRTNFKIKVGDNFIELLKNQLDSEEQGQDVENTETEETGMTKEYGQEFVNISGISSASTRLKLALSFVPKRDNKGDVIKDMYGFDQYYNHEQIYYWLERNLVGITDMNEMLDKIKTASLFKPELGDVYNMLTEVSEGDSIEEHEMFRNEFRSNFAKQQMVFVLVTYSKDSSGVTYKIIDSNRQGLGREIMDRWRRNVTQQTNTIAEIDKDGVAVVHGTDKAIKLKKDYQDMIGTMTVPQMKEVLSKIGIDFSDGVIEKVFDSDRKQEFINELIPILNWYAEADYQLLETNAKVALGKLVLFELSGNLNGYTSSFNNVENKAIYTIQNPTYASKTLSTIKSSRSKFEAYFDERMQDPFFKYSNLLNELNEDDKFREEQFKVLYLNGLKDHKGNSKGAKWTKMNVSDKFNMAIELFNNRKEENELGKTARTAYYSNMTESDKTLHTLIQSKKYVAKTMPITSNGKTITVINPASEIVNKFYNVALNEAGRIKQAIDFKNKYLATEKGSDERAKLDGNMLEYYHFVGKDKTAFNGQAFKFMQINALNDLLDDITERINNNPNLDIVETLKPLETEIKQAIANDLTQVYRNTVADAVNNGSVKFNENDQLEAVTLDIFSKDTEGNVINMSPKDEDLAIKRLLANFSTNEYLNNIEYSAIMNGDLAFYKPGDGPKRFYQANSMTRTWNTNVVSKIDFSIVADHEVPVNDESLSFLKDNLKELPSNYDKDVNVTDATVFISPELWKKIRMAEGRWDKSAEKAYNIGQGIEEADYTDNTWQDQITVDKPFIYGQQWDENLGVMVPRQVKCTFVPLFNRFTKSSPVLADLAYKMGQAKTDAVATRSAMKAAMNINDQFLTTNLSFNNTLSIKVADAGTQVDNPDHLVDSQSSSNRQQKMLIPGVVDPAHNYSGRSGADVRAEINSIEATNVQESLEALDKAYNNSELNEYLAEALNSRNATNNQRDVLHVNEDGGFDYPLDFINSTNTENMISSIFTKRVVRQEFKGGSAVQVTGLGYKFNSDYKTVGELQGIIESNDKLKKLQSDLKWFRKSETEANKIEYVDAVMPAWSKQFFKKDEQGRYIPMKANDLPADIRTLLIQRIPNEGPHSNMVIRVKEFLEPEFGNMIILPYEVTLQLGADFDFDKVYFHRPEFKVQKDGSLKKVQYIDGNTENDVNKRYELYVAEKLVKNMDKVEAETMLVDKVKSVIKDIKQKGELFGLQTNDEVYKLIDEIDRLEALMPTMKSKKVKKALEDNIWDLQASLAKYESIRNFLAEELAQSYKTKDMAQSMMFDRLIDMGAMISREDFAKQSIIRQNTKAARNNRLLDNYDLVLRDMHHLKDVSTPSGFDNILDMFKLVGSKQNLLNFYTGSTQRYYADLFHSIIGLKGQSATHVTGHAFASMMNLNPKVKIFIDNQEYGTLSNRVSKDGNLIVKEMSSMMAAILDAVKNPDLLPSLGINDKSIDAWATIVRLGAGVKAASLFTSSPAIKMLTNSLRNNSKQIKSSEQVNESIDSIIAKFTSKLDAVSSMLEKERPDQHDRFVNSAVYKAINDDKNYVSLNTEVMLRDIQYNREKTEDKTKYNLEKEAYYLANQIRLLQNFATLKPTMEYTNEFNRLLAVNKEVGPDIESIIDKVYLGKKLELSQVVEGFNFESIPQLKEIYKAHESALANMSKEFPYNSEQYKLIKNTIAKLQYKNNDTNIDLLQIKAEDRNKINGFIKMYTDANSNAFSDTLSTEEKQRLLSKVPLRLSEIQKPANDKKEGFFDGKLRRNALIENLEIKRISDVQPIWHISLRGNRLTTEMKNQIIEGFRVLYNNKATKDFAVDLIKHSFVTTGFYTGLNSYSSLIPVEIFNELGATEDTIGFTEFRRLKTAYLNQGTSFFTLEEVDRLIDQLVRNNPKAFTKTYNDDIFSGFDKSNKPETISVVESLLKNEDRSKLIVGVDVDVDGNKVNVYQRYIRVYSKKYGGSLLYKNVDELGTSLEYKLVNYLGQAGRLIEIDPKNDLNESIVVKNNYDTYKAPEQISEQQATQFKPLKANYTWARYADANTPSYEVSSQGDRRFSAYSATIKAGTPVNLYNRPGYVLKKDTTIEELYQVGIKGYGTIQEGKGQNPLNPLDRDQLFSMYKELWRTWGMQNSDYMRDLAEKASDRVLTDKFATTDINQARALAEIINESITGKLTGVAIPTERTNNKFQVTEEDINNVDEANDEVDEPTAQTVEPVITETSFKAEDFGLTEEDLAELENENNDQSSPDDEDFTDDDDFNCVNPIK